MIIFIYDNSGEYDYENQLKSWERLRNKSSTDFPSFTSSYQLSFPVKHTYDVFAQSATSLLIIDEGQQLACYYHNYCEAHIIRTLCEGMLLLVPSRDEEQRIGYRTKAETTLVISITNKRKARREEVVEEKIILECKSRSLLLLVVPPARVLLLKQLY